MSTALDRAPAADVVKRLGGHRLVVCCGSGGVGKTTVSAALGMAIATVRDSAVLVLTVDPARRLATALGMPTIGTVPVTIAPERLHAAGLAPVGRLDAAMLDARSAWDRLVDRHAPSQQVRDRILANRFYRGISTAFAGSHEYIALDTVSDLLNSGEYGCIVVDTPPSRSALDLLDAPDRLTDFVSARLLAWLAGPSRIGLRAMGFAATPFLRMADRLLGGEVLEELGAFVRDIQGLYDGVRLRAAAMRQQLRSRSTAFAVVTTLDPQPLAEAEFLCAELRRRSMPLAAVVVNRVLPASLRDQSAAAAAARLVSDRGLPAWLAAELGVPVSSAAAERVGQAFLVLHALAVAQETQVAKLARFPHTPVVGLPLAEREVHDVASLGQLARRLIQASTSSGRC